MPGNINSRDYKDSEGSTDLRSSINNAAMHERIASGFMTLTTFKMHRVRSIVFTAGWFAAHATENWLLIVAFAASFTSTNPALPPVFGLGLGYKF